LPIRKLPKIRPKLLKINVNLIKLLLPSALPIRPKPHQSASNRLLQTKSAVKLRIKLLQIRKLQKIRPKLNKRLRMKRKPVPNLRQMMKNVLKIKLHPMTALRQRLETINVLRLLLMLLQLLKLHKTRLLQIRKLGLLLVLHLKLRQNNVLQKEILLPHVLQLWIIANSVLNLDG